MQPFRPQTNTAKSPLFGALFLCANVFQNAAIRASGQGYGFALLLALLAHSRALTNTHLPAHLVMIAI